MYVYTYMEAPIHPMNQWVSLKKLQYVCNLWVLSQLKCRCCQ